MGLPSIFFIADMRLESSILVFILVADMRHFGTEILFVLTAQPIKTVAFETLIPRYSGTSFWLRLRLSFASGGPCRRLSFLRAVARFALCGHLLCGCGPPAL